MEKQWLAYAKKHLKDRKIVAVRYMTKEEAEDVGWNCRPVVMLLDNETILFCSADEEGNGPGVIFGATKNNAEELTFPILP